MCVPIDKIIFSTGEKPASCADFVSLATAAGGSVVFDQVDQDKYRGLLTEIIFNTG